MDSFIIYALIAAGIIAVSSSFVGLFIVWRKMAYFADSLAHSSLLGVALGIIAEVSVNVSVVMFSFTFALLLIFLQHKKLLSTDTLLGVFAHSALAISIVIISIFEINIDIHSYLFGNILTITTEDLLIISIGGLISILLIVSNWNALILSTLNEELAQAEGINTLKVNIILMLSTTVLVSVAIQIVGILLLGAMLIIPIALSKNIAKSPKFVVVYAMIFGLIAVFFGMYASATYDTPTSPAIVGILSILFIIIFAVINIKNRISAK